MQATKGRVPAEAQAGIKPTLVVQNYFLACSCHPDNDIEIVLPEKNLGKLEAEISSIEFLCADILGIRLKPSRDFLYKAGQFINLFMDETTARCYSLASVPGLDEELYLNVRKVPEGLVSNWIFEHLEVGKIITISEATGDCFYVPGNAGQDILLIGTGSGLAPLYGIIRDALLAGHSGQIKLYHGSNFVSGFYLVDQLRKLAQTHANFSYTPCVSEEAALNGYAHGMVLDVALRDNPDLSGWRVFLCGNPLMVNAAKQETYLAGAAIHDIFADPFN
jgi:NAD(P)H-flavin reductase